MSEYQLGVIGGGNMAEAILRGVVDGGFIPAGGIVVSDVSQTRREHLAGELGVSCVADNRAAALCPCVLLAVKPQVMGDVLEQISASVSGEATVISIAAGITTSFLDTALSGKGQIVRVMPNTPLMVGQGMSAITAGPRATENDLQWVRELFSASGKTVIVEEKMMDAVTAVSGSGPAYFFYLVEAMVEAGIAEGLPAEIAKQLAAQTCLGAGKLMVQSSEDPSQLRKRVTSPGGTTQRAIEVLDTANVKQNLIQAIHAAAKKSRELGQ